MLHTLVRVPTANSYLFFFHIWKLYSWLYGWTYLKFTCQAWQKLENSSPTKSGLLNTEEPGVRWSLNKQLQELVGTMMFTKQLGSRLWEQKNYLYAREMAPFCFIYTRITYKKISASHVPTPVLYYLNGKRFCYTRDTNLCVGRTRMAIKWQKNASFLQKTFQIFDVFFSLLKFTSHPI